MPEPQGGARRPGGNIGPSFFEGLTMTLALMGALPEELAGLRAALVAPAVHHHAGREFVTGRLDGHVVGAAWPIACTGMPGKT